MHGEWAGPLHVDRASLVGFLGLGIGSGRVLLSTPLTMTAKITLEGNDDTRWIALLLGTGSDAAESVSQSLPESVEELTDLERPL